MKMQLEVVVIPISDVERAKRFYESLGWNLDLDFTGVDDDYRVVQLIPPGSSCSVILGTNVTTAVPGSIQGLHLVVTDGEAVRADLIRRGVQVSVPFHDIGGVFHHSNSRYLVEGMNPQRRSYASYFSFSDPDGNGWFVQEVSARLTPDLRRGDPRFTPEVIDAALSTASRSNGG